MFLFMSKKMTCWCHFVIGNVDSITTWLKSLLFRVEQSWSFESNNIQYTVVKNDIVFPVIQKKIAKFSQLHINCMLFLTNFQLCSQLSTTVFYLTSASNKFKLLRIYLRTQDGISLQGCGSQNSVMKVWS